jgi:hypothetical protein
LRTAIHPGEPRRRAQAEISGECVDRRNAPGGLIESHAQQTFTRGENHRIGERGNGIASIEHRATERLRDGVLIAGAAIQLPGRNGEEPALGGAAAISDP